MVCSNEDQYVDIYDIIRKGKNKSESPCQHAFSKGILEASVEARWLGDFGIPICYGTDLNTSLSKDSHPSDPIVLYRRKIA